MCRLLDTEDHCRVCLIKYTFSFAATVKISITIYCNCISGKMVPNRSNALNELEIR